MKNYYLVCGLSLFLATAASGQSSPGANSAILGCQRVQLTPGWQLMGVPFEPFAAAQGTVGAVQDNQLAVTCESGFGTNQWRGYQVRLTSGTAAGRQYLVIGNGVNSLTLSANLSGSGIATGDTYEVLPTVEEYLGPQLTGAANPANADSVATDSTKQLTPLYRTTSGQWLNGQGQPAWLSVVSGQGFWINPATSRSVLLMGRYQGDPGGVAVAAGRQVISFPSSSASLTLASLGWQGAIAGSTSDSSDQLSVWNDATGTFHTCWLNAATGQWVWQDTGENAGSLELAGGQGYLYQHVGNGFYLRWR
jgi:hypothetical protein